MFYKVLKEYISSMLRM